MLGIERSEGKKDGGYPVVLTTDRTLASDYNESEFVGFGATFPRVLPDFLYSSFFAPPVPHKDGIVEFGHCGSRKVEASLLNDGFSPDEVAIGHPDHLDKLIGPSTRALGITTHDPLGLGPASTTFSAFVRGEPYSSHYFKKLIDNPDLSRYGVNVIVGGPGTWQLDDKRIMKKFNVDTIVVGEGERVAPKIFRKALNGGDLPKKVNGGVVSVEDIPKIQGPTINGLVEISRGCGRGCDFCNPTLLNLRHRPVQDIVDEVKLNVQTGREKTILHAEDVLRYGTKKLVPDPEKLMDLLKRVKKHTHKVDFSHIALASVASKPELIEEISELFDIGSEKKPWFSAQTGLETGSPDLASEHIKGKAKPFDAEEWPSVVREAFGVLDENDWVPCTTLIMGLPGETGDDVMKTMELLDDISDKDFFVVPLMFVPLGISEDEDFFTRNDMESEHWQLLARCIKKDFEVVPKLIDDISKMGGMSSFKRFGYHIMSWYMMKRLKPHIKEMEQGYDPARVR
ncbi:MAG: B12-binding domain-containing radical SAM protein [Candidatus Aenigmatarchaeota archaeon]